MSSNRDEETEVKLKKEEISQDEEKEPETKDLSEDILDVQNNSAPIKSMLLLMSKFEGNFDVKKVASVLLSAVGDSLGYYNSKFEFNYSGTRILKKLEKMGGISKIVLYSGKSKDEEKWMVSDDTVMHLATLRGLQQSDDFDVIMNSICKEYVECFEDMRGRAPGGSCRRGVNHFRGMLRSKGKVDWTQGLKLYAGSGCGGAMRAMCIGLKFHGKKNRDDLIRVSIESGRLSHTTPNGFLGAMVSAVFTAFAYEEINPIKWGKLLLSEIFPKAMEYLKNEKTRRHQWNKIEIDSGAFIGKFVEFLIDRGIRQGDSEPKYPDKFLRDVEVREKYYRKFCFSPRQWPGGEGLDCVIMSYDFLLMGGNDFKKVTMYSCFHGGDNDSTGAVALAFYGALYGFKNIDEKRYGKLICSVEKFFEIMTLTKDL